MYPVSGRPVQWSRNTFLSVPLNMYIVRDLFEARHLGSARYETPASTRESEA